MKRGITLFLCGLAIAGAASIAIAAQKGGTGKPVKHHMKAGQKSQLLVQPRTMKQADAQLVRLPSGELAQPIPTELWNHMAVQKDAQGKPHVVDTSSPEVPAGVKKGLDHE